MLARGLRSARGLPLVALIAATDRQRRNHRGAGHVARIASGNAAPCGCVSGVLRAIARVRFPNEGLALGARHDCGDVLALLRAPVVAAHTGFPPDSFPVRAAAELEKLPVGMRLLAPDKFGGYLIYRFEGRVQVFSLTAAAICMAPRFLKQYARLVQLRPGWQE